MEQCRVPMFQDALFIITTHLPQQDCLELGNFWVIHIRLLALQSEYLKGITWLNLH
jgi:hypothetical protein